MTRSTYWIESLVPSWLLHDGGYRHALTQHLRARLEHHGYDVDAPIRIKPVTGDVSAPVGMLMLRAETEVVEFDIEVGEG
ncbi:hypothetical protein SMD44_00932 [Streptomyces alboflavus]|uniref:Uncharacterized protein n=1 Tax=Streptomyces alboflavus TaxID=67267 RepID=A0A1Z1W548_9ACTN|nr:hypothetical protein [Streptomyces alboflavus]ARX81534.1 hypothetical protein SMD44_00932 [Streptomyces alboflavus]